jgi:hypothetical protein
LTTARTATLARGVDTRMPMLVVDSPLVRFAENFVSLFGFLEFFGPDEISSQDGGRPS